MRGTLAMKTILLYTLRFNPGYDSFYRSLMREGRRRGWCFAFVEPQPGPDEPARMARLFARLKPAGLVSGYAKGGPLEPPPWLPSVWIDCDRAPRGAPLVRHDNASFGAAAADALLAGGGTDFAAFGLTRHDWSDARVRAFASRVRAAGGRCRTVRLEARNENQFDALDPIRDELARLPRPVSVFAVTDRLAQVSLMAAESIGRRCPRDIRIVGVDDDEVVCMGGPTSLSSVHPDWELGGRLVVEALETQMNGRRPRRTYVYGAAGVTRRASTRPAYRRPKDERVRLGLDFIDAEFDSPIGLADVVAAMGCSKRLAQLRFREETGKTISAAIMERRLARAEVLLRRMRPDFATLPAMCGFRTMAALRAAFKAVRGVSMTEWRRRERHEPLS